MVKKDKSDEATDTVNQSTEQPDEPVETLTADAAKTGQDDGFDDDVSRSRDDSGQDAREESDAAAESDAARVDTEQTGSADAEPIIDDPNDPLDRALSEMEEIVDRDAPRETGENEIEADSATVIEQDRDRDDLEEALVSDPQGDENKEPVAEPEPEPEPQAATTPTPAPEPQVVRGSMWPGFFGGVIAALIGFIVGRGEMLDDFLPASMQRSAVDTSALEAQAESAQAQAAEVAETAKAQEARISALESAAAEPPAAAPAEIPSDLLDSVAALQAQVATLSQTVAQLESRPAEPAEPSASQDDLEALQSALDAQNAEIAALSERAEAAESRAAGEAGRILAAAALMRVQSAVDSGETFAPALTELEEVAPVSVPEPLREAAEAGVPTLAALQEAFPAAARAGLAAARAEVPESEVSGIAGFITRQLNVRSITPREGSDPDAILSRAQAAMAAGDLDTALSEMEALPEVARTAMNDWLEAASARKAVLDAASELADSLNSN